MTSMLEKVARAIAGVNEFGSDLLHKHYETDPEGFEELARAAIEAMKTPTPAMIEAGTKADWVGQNEGREGRAIMSTEDEADTFYDDGVDRRGIWPAMIDSALAESKEG